MNNESVNEIFKAFAYDVPLNEISNYTGISEKGLSKLYSENEYIIEEIKKYYKDMEG